MPKVFFLGCLISTLSLLAAEFEEQIKCNRIVRICLFYTSSDNTSLSYCAYGIQAVDNEVSLLSPCVFSWEKLNDERIKAVEDYMISKDFVWIQEQPDSWADSQSCNDQCFKEHGYQLRVERASSCLKRVLIRDMQKKPADHVVTVKKVSNSQELTVWWDTVRQCFDLSFTQQEAIKNYIEKFNNINKNYDFWIAYYDGVPVCTAMTIIACFDNVFNECDYEITLHFVAVVSCYKYLEPHRYLMYKIMRAAEREHIRGLWFLSSPLILECFDQEKVSDFSNNLQFYKKKISYKKYLNHQEDSEIAVKNQAASAINNKRRCDLF